MTQTDQIIAIASAACPKTTLDGAAITDPAAYSLGILQPAINKALKAGKTPQRIAAVLVNMVQREGWVHATGEFSDTDLLDGLGMIASTATPGQAPTPSAADILANASNGANIAEAQASCGFYGFDGIKHGIDDPDYAAARTAFLGDRQVTGTLPPDPTFGVGQWNGVERRSGKDRRGSQTVFGKPGY
jgi:hypothetical protein